MITVTVYAPVGSSDHKTIVGGVPSHNTDTDTLVVTVPHPHFSVQVFQAGEWSGYRVDRADPPVVEVDDHCEFCGETIDWENPNEGDGVAEFFDPKPSGRCAAHRIGHYICARSAGWQQA